MFLAESSLWSIDSLWSDTTSSWWVQPIRSRVATLDICSLLGRNIRNKAFCITRCLSPTEYSRFFLWLSSPCYNMNVINGSKQACIFSTFLKPPDASPYVSFILWWEHETSYLKRRRELPINSGLNIPSWRSLGCSGNTDGLISQLVASDAIHKILH